MVFFEDQVADVLERVEVQSTLGAWYFFMKVLMSFIVSSFSCLFYNLHS